MESQIVLTLPSWLHDAVAQTGQTFKTDADKMQLAIALSRENVARGGGPFGAAVFDGARCVAAGVNRVLDTGYSIAHAEIVAIMAAQHALRSLAHGQVSVQAVDATPSLTLVTSAEPCCQCFGAIVWSGLDRVVCGATTADVEAIGFDEGPKPADWQQCLRARAIQVVEQVQRDDARDVLQQYKQRGGVIYGLRHPTVIK